MVFYAHSKPDTAASEWQPLIDHLTRTGDMAFELGRDAGVSELARVAGCLHDIGKYSQAFQRRLEGSPQHVDHALLVLLVGKAKNVEAGSLPSVCCKTSDCPTVVGNTSSCQNVISPCPPGPEGSCY